MPIIHDHRIPTPSGHLHARSWTPAGAGERAPLILLHDSLGSVALWRDFPAQLATATGRRVIAYDRLGFGQSAARTDKLAPDFIAEEATTGFAAVRHTLGIGRFIVFGHSVGGGMAVNIAARHADDCLCVITESAQAFVEARTIHGIEDARALFADPDQRERLARYHGEKTDWVLDAWIGTWLAPAFAGWSLDAVLPRVRCPLLAIHGEQDEYGSPAHPQRITQLAGGPARMVLLPHTHHVPHRERAADIVALVADAVRPLDQADVPAPPQ